MDASHLGQVVISALNSAFVDCHWVLARNTRRQSNYRGNLGPLDHHHYHQSQAIQFLLDISNRKPALSSLRDIDPQVRLDGAFSRLRVRSQKFVIRIMFQHLHSITAYPIASSVGKLPAFLTTTVTCVEWTIPRTLEIHYSIDKLRYEIRITHV